MFHRYGDVHVMCLAFVLQITTDDAENYEKSVMDEYFNMVQDMPSNKATVSTDKINLIFARSCFRTTSGAILFWCKLYFDYFINTIQDNYIQFIQDLTISRRLVLTSFPVNIITFTYITFCLPCPIKGCQTYMG